MHRNVHIQVLRNVHCNMHSRVQKVLCTVHFQVHRTTASAHAVLRMHCTAPSANVAPSELLITMHYTAPNCALYCTLLQWQIMHLRSNLLQHCSM